MKYIRLKAFSFVEIMVSITIISLVLVISFSLITSAGVYKIKIIEQTEIEKQAFFASEYLFELIKQGGTIDYEEYWNRSNYNTTFSSGAYALPSGYGNFGNTGNISSSNYGWRPYLCLSPDGGSMGTNGCKAANNISWNGSNPSVDYSGRFSRYGQYEFQFLDVNSDGDNNQGDEDGDGSQLGDDDDKYLGLGPDAFDASSSNRVGELYLISPNGDERTYFRYFVRLDPDAPAGATCSGSQDMTGSGCLGTVQMLKLSGRDYGYDHVSGAGGALDRESDGFIDTWLIHDDFTGSSSEVIAGNVNSYWQDLFSTGIHVKHLEFYVYPEKDYSLAWKEDMQNHISPYVQIKMTVEPSWSTRKKIRGAIPSIELSSTMTLSDINFR